MTPLGSRLLLKPIPPPDHVGTLWVPQSSEDFTVLQAEVVERGPKVYDWRLQPGARVVCRKYNRVPVAGDHWIADESSVVAILR